MENNKKELGVKSAISFMGIIIGSAVNFLMILIIGYLLGAETFGVYTYVLSFIIILSVVPKWGMDIGLIAFLARTSYSDKEKRNLLTFALFLVTLTCSLIIMLIEVNATSFSRIIFGDIKYDHILSVLSPIVLLISLNSIFNGAFRGYKRIKETIGVTQIIAPSMQLLSIVILSKAFNYNTVYSLIISEYIKNIVSLFYYTYKSLKYNYLGKLIVSNKNKLLFLYSVPLFLNGIVSIVINNLDKYMIGLYLEDSLVAVYKVALQIGTFSAIALTSVNTIFSSIVSNLYSEDNVEEIERLYKLSTKWILSINMAILGIIILFSRELMTIIGAEFTIGWKVLIIISIGQTINAMFGSVGVLNSMTGRPKAQFISGLSACITNVILNFVFIKIYGIVGAGIASMIALMVRNIISFIFMYDHLAIHPFSKDTFKVLALFTITSATSYVILQLFAIQDFGRLLVGMPMFMIIYLISTILVILSIDERNKLKSIIATKIKTLR